ncbi:hypothetical protein UCRPC4_g00070 [Phaeomoniella chlamydospora]|uniref:Uncharacterized protein n=1 Tax=Phaeomoniella chlamydospora TaxID=158046 RepID=A0A0G2F4I4_PHACM|nr:hypothetical protein UCRPC4_g00070 [Phaeomoniella chlamydospora]
MNWSFLTCRTLACRNTASKCLGRSATSTQHRTYGKKTKHDAVVETTSFSGPPAPLGTKYEITAPLYDELVRLEGHIRKASLPKFPHKAQKVSKTNSLQPAYDLSSTRPPPLTLPERLLTKPGEPLPPITENVKNLFHIAKGYLAFYKAGLKQLWANYKEYRQIVSRARAFDKLHWTTSEKDLISKLREFRRSTGITRREYNLYLRTRRDLRKLVPFGLVFLIFGEFSPLVLLPLGPRIIPFPCLLPQQVWQQYAKGNVVVKVGLEDVSQTKPNRPNLDIIPSHNTWRSFRKQLIEIDTNIKPEPGLQRQKFIPTLWYKPHPWSTERPLADAVLILEEGGVDKLDNNEVLLWVWETHDLYLRWLWYDALLSFRKLRNDGDVVDEKQEVAGWTQVDEIDLYDVRRELELTLQNFVRLADLYARSGQDYDPSAADGDKAPTSVHGFNGRG